jgi:hypothetical protein
MHAYAHLDVFEQPELLLSCLLKCRLDNIVMGHAIDSLPDTVVHLTKTQPTILLIHGLQCGFTATL